jgi:predicted enzyme related to lactoylglutathione lyase
VVSQFAQWTLDVNDVATMAAFWSQALGYDIEPGENGAHLWPADGEGRQGRMLSVWLQPTDAAKAGKNRGHPDLVAADGDVDGEVTRLVGLGATHADVGQRGDEGFVVLRDPEGNEFCVLRRKG